MTAVGVDPRLRARRVAVQRAAGRRRLKRLLMFVTVLLVVLGTYGIARSPLLDVDSVNYSGLEQTSLDDVIAAAGLEEGVSLIGIDLDGASRRIEALPWIDVATVERSWNGTISVGVTERTAIASVMTAQDQWALIDRSGRVLTGVVSVSPDLPKISGVSAAGAPGSRLSADADAAILIASLLPARLDGSVDGIYLDEQGELWISLKSADRIILGTATELSFKVTSFTSVLEELDRRGRTGFELDVAVPSLPVVRDLRPELQPAS